MNPAFFVKDRCFKKTILSVVLMVAAMSAPAAVEQDILFSYAPSYAASQGGEANTRVSFANVAAGVNAMYDQSGAGAHWRVAGYYQSINDPVNWTTTGGMVGWLSGYNGNVVDVDNYADSVGADLLLYVVQNSDAGSFAGVTQQPGRYGVVNPGSVWSGVVAHEIGGHAYGCSHGAGFAHANDNGHKTIMLHNYCAGGGAAPPYYFSNPNIWWDGENIANMPNCQGGGGDNSYTLSAAAQGVTDRYLRVVYGPVLTNLVYHWAFTNTAGSAPAGTTNYDLVSAAPAVVRGNGATYTGNALRIPGGTTGNTAMSLIAAYIDLPNGILSSQTNITIEIWATPQSAQNWARIMDFGNCSAGELSGNPGDLAPGTTSQTDGITLTACIGTDITQQRFEAKRNGTTYTINSSLATTAGVQHHYAITFSDGTGAYGSAGGRWQWYRDGDAVGFLDVSNHLAAIQDVNEWLGRSEWSGDSLANSDYAEVRISNVAMNQWQVMANYLVGPNYVPRSATMTSSDQWGGTRSFNAAGNWSDGLAPSAGKSYDLYGFNLITPNTTSPYTFAGDSLHASGGIFFGGASGSSTITVNNFQIDNEEICNGTTSGGSTMTLAGNLYVTNNCIVRGSTGPINVSANLNGNGSMTLYANNVSLTGNNTNYTGKIRVGNGITGALNLTSEAQLGANPPSFTSDQLIFNRGWLYTTTSFTISNSNRGILIGVNDGIFDQSSGTTLTLGCPLSSGETITSGNTLVNQSEPSGIVAGVLIKQNSGTLALTSSNPNFNGAIAINGGTLSVAGAGQLGGGTFANPFTDNGIFDFSSSAAQTISGVISGTGAINKNGSGTLTLAGANTLTGAVTVNSGTLYANPGNAANNRACSYVSGITVNSGATLRAGQNGLFGWDGTQEHPITVNAGGTLTCDSAADVGVGTVTLNGGTLANLGASTVFGSWRFDEAGDRLLVTDNSTLSAVNVKFGSPAAYINVSAGKTLTVNGTITDASSGGASCLTMSNGVGTVLLTGANPFTGTATVGSGRLVLTNSASLGSTNIIVGNGATFDISGLTSIFTVGSGKALGGSGTNNGSVATVSGAKIYAGSDGGYGTNTFNQNLTLVSGAALYFDLGASAAGANDKLVVLGNLNLTNTVFHIKAPNGGVNLDAANDYLLATVAGTLSGTVTPTPVWDVQAGNYGAFAVVITNGNQIVLHAVAIPPAFTAASATPSTAGRNQSIAISAAVVQGGYPISTVTANAAAFGGPSTLSLVFDGTSNYTNSFAATPDTTFGAKILTLTVSDTANISSATNLVVTIAAANRVWNGGSGTDNNWSSNPNWSTSAAPGFIGDGVLFDGSTRLSPVMETNYSVTGVTFNNTAGAFTLGASGKYLTLTGSGVTNNSTATETINIPISMGSAETFNAAAGNLTFGQGITNNGNLVTATGNSNVLASGVISGSGALVKTGTGKLTLAANNTYTNTTTVTAGSLDVSGVVGGGDKTIANASGKAVLNISGTFTNGNVVVGAVSGSAGALYQTAGSYSSAGGFTYLGHLPGAYGYARVDGGTFSVPANDLQVGTWGSSGGAGGNGVFEMSGGTVTDAGWLILGRGTSGQTNLLNVFGGIASYAGGGLVNCWGTNQVGTVNVLGGVVSNSVTAGINLNQSGAANNAGTLNLNGGTVQANYVSGANSRLNFNGGTLKASTANTAFVAGLGASTVYSNGATINNNGVAITFNQPLLAPAGKGVNGIASFTGGAGYIAPPIITVNRGAGDTTGVGATAIAQIDRNAGTVTNVLITCPGVNYTATPTFTLSGGGATTQATVTGQAPTTNLSGGLAVNGSGAVTLSSGNSYSGTTAINGGTVRIARPVVQLSFDNVVGSTVKNLGSGGSAMDGTIIGTATISASGKFGNALSIGSGAVTAGYVAISNAVVPLNVSGTWTVGMWIKTATAGGVYAYQGDGSWVSGNTTFHLNNGSTDTAGSQAGGVRWGQGWERGTATLTDNAWHFVVMTCNAGTKISYVDGAVDAWTSGQDQWSGSGTGGQFWIGGTPNTGDGDVALNGLIDEVYIFDRALTPAEIQLLSSTNKMQPLPVTSPVSVASGAVLDLSGISQSVASLSGAGLVTNSIGLPVTLTLSNNATATAFSGIVGDIAVSNAVSLVQLGTATNTFTGANTYRGTTLVRSGTFLVNGSLGTNIVTVTNGTLGGFGTVNGAVIVQNGGILSPGSGIGKLTASSVTLQPGSTTFLEISKAAQTNDQLRVIGALACGGALNVTNLSGTPSVNDSFPLFNAGSITGAFAATNLPPLNPGLGWSFNGASGVLTVIQTVATNSTNVDFSISGNALTLSWPADHTGWHLQAQTNSLTSGLGTNWFDVPGTSATNSVTLPVDAANGSVFYRLVYP